MSSKVGTPRLSCLQVEWVGGRVVVGGDGGGMYMDLGPMLRANGRGAVPSRKKMPIFA